MRVALGSSKELAGWKIYEWNGDFFLRGRGGI